MVLAWRVEFLPDRQASELARQAGRVARAARNGRRRRRRQRSASASAVARPSACRRCPLPPPLDNPALTTTTLKHAPTYPQMAEAMWEQTSKVIGEQRAEQKAVAAKRKAEGMEKVVEQLEVRLGRRREGREGARGGTCGDSSARRSSPRPGEATRPPPRAALRRAPNVALVTDPRPGFDRGPGPNAPTPVPSDRHRNPNSRSPHPHPKHPTTPNPSAGARAGAGRQPRGASVQM